MLARNAPKFESEHKFVNTPLPLLRGEPAPLPLLVHLKRFPSGGGSTVAGHGLGAVLAGNVFAVVALQGDRSVCIGAPDKRFPVADGGSCRAATVSQFGSVARTHSRRQGVVSTVDWQEVAGRSEGSSI